ncbi:MAG TPA: SMI1/KNR4 family protein [Kribbella sp.]
MTANSGYDEVLDLLAEVERPPSRRPVAGAADEQLDGLCRALAFEPPAELLDWLRVCNGVIAGPGGIYGADPPENFLDIGGVLELLPSWRENRWIPVAGDGTGNHYVLDATRQHLDRDAVYFVDVMEDPDALSYLVASSLERFLRFLLLADLGDRRWPFDEEHVSAEDPAIVAVGPASLLPWNA